MEKVKLYDNSKLYVLELLERGIADKDIASLTDVGNRQLAIYKRVFRREKKRGKMRKALTEQESLQAGLQEQTYFDLDDAKRKICFSIKKLVQKKGRKDGLTVIVDAVNAMDGRILPALRSRSSVNVNKLNDKTYFYDYLIYLPFLGEFPEMKSVWLDNLESNKPWIYFGAPFEVITNNTTKAFEIRRVSDDNMSGLIPFVEYPNLRKDPLMESLPGKPIMPSEFTEHLLLQFNRTIDAFCKRLEVTSKSLS